MSINEIGRKTNLICELHMTYKKINITYEKFIYNNSSCLFFSSIQYG